MARVTGLEPATSGVTGRRSNQLSYTRLKRVALVRADLQTVNASQDYHSAKAIDAQLCERFIRFKAMIWEGAHQAMARVTGLEPATSGVTGRRSNQLSYTRLKRVALVRAGLRTVNGATPVSV